MKPKGHRPVERADIYVSSERFNTWLKKGFIEFVDGNWVTTIGSVKVVVGRKN
jgi:hypothetical protein